MGWKRYAIIFFLGLMVGAALGDTEFDIITYQNNTEVNLNVLCIDSGLPCDSSYTCKLTSYYPDYTSLLINGTMSFNSTGYYNYSLGNLSTTGDYHASVTCSKGTLYGTNDASFRVVTKLLYNGGGINTFDIALSMGIIGIAILMGFMSLFSKSVWLRTIFLFGSLLSIIVAGNLFLQISALENQAQITTGLLGFYTMLVVFAIIAFVVFMLNLLWDVLDMFGKLPEWGKRWGKRKNELEED